jgi:hypothetical protein
MRKVTSLLLFLLELFLGCSEVASPPDNPPEEKVANTPVRTTFPYDKLGNGTFFLAEGTNSYLIDSRAKTFSVIHVTVWTTVVMSPNATMLAGGGLETGTTLYDYKHAIIVSNIASDKWSFLASDYNYKNFPSWSHDGSSVIFLEADQTNRPVRIRRVNVSTGAATTIDTQSDPKCPWVFDLDRTSERQDGTIIFLDKTSATLCAQALVSIRADGTQKKLIANASSNDHLYSPSWSPDGKQIALMVYNLIPSTTTPATTIRILNADGTGQHDLVSLPRNTRYTHEPEGDALCWSADQTRLLFALFEPDGGYHIYSIKPDGTDLTQIAAAFTLSCGR